MTQRMVLQFLLSSIPFLNSGFIPSYRSPMCKLGRERKAGEGIEQTCSGDDALYSTDSCGCGESTATNSTSEGPHQLKDSGLGGLVGVVGMGMGVAKATRLRPRGH